MLKVKVCGMTDAGNVAEICTFDPDFIGYIFYPKSARYVGDQPDPAIFRIVPDGIRKTGVFVNENYERIVELSENFGLAHIQLHGMESPEMCNQLRSTGKVVIKAVPVDQLENKKLIDDYASACDYLLFDTPSITYGGSGRKFDWSRLEKVEVPKSFFLSGGIAPEDAGNLLKMDYKNLFAIDINSRFELEVGIKNPALVASFINMIRYEV